MAQFCPSVHLLSKRTLGTIVPIIQRYEAAGGKAIDCDKILVPVAPGKRLNGHSAFAFTGRRTGLPANAHQRFVSFSRYPADVNLDDFSSTFRASQSSHFYKYKIFLSGLQEMCL
jgi:hypothetical protein